MPTANPWIGFGQTRAKHRSANRRRFLGGHYTGHADTDLGKVPRLAIPRFELGIGAGVVNTGLPYFHVVLP